MKKILSFIILISFLFGQSLTKGWYNDSFEVPDSLWAKSVTVTGGTPGSGKVLTSDPTGIGTWQTPGTGEVNTASNQGAGIGVFDNKNVLDLEFRSLVPQNNRLTIGLDAGNKEIDFTIVEANIDHDALANFLATEHFIQSAIVETGAVNAGSITSGFGNIDIGADTYTTTGLVKTDTLKATGNVDIDGELTLGADARYPVEGYTTGRNVQRVTVIKIAVGGTPGTNLTISDESSASNSFNSVSTLTTSTNITSGGGDGGGAFEFTTVSIDVDLTEVVIGVGAVTTIIQDVENSDATAQYHYTTSISNGNIIIYAIPNGNNAVFENWVNILTTAGDAVYLKLTYWTST